MWTGRLIVGASILFSLVLGVLVGGLSGGGTEPKTAITAATSESTVTPGDTIDDAPGWYVPSRPEASPEMTASPESGS